MRLTSEGSPALPEASFCSQSCRQEQEQEQEQEEEQQSSKRTQFRFDSSGQGSSVPIGLEGSQESDHPFFTPAYMHVLPYYSSQHRRNKIKIAVVVEHTVGMHHSKGSSGGFTSRRRFDSFILEQLKAEMSFVPAVEMFSQFYDVAWFQYAEILQLGLQKGQHGNASALSQIWADHRFVFVYGKWCGKLDRFIRKEAPLSARHVSVYHLARPPASVPFWQRRASTTGQTTYLFIISLLLPHTERAGHVNRVLVPRASRPPSSRSWLRRTMTSW
jgi:hypothetical protein